MSQSGDILFTAGSYTELKAFRMHQNLLTGETESLVQVSMHFPKSELHPDPRKAKHVRIMDIKAFQLSKGDNSE